MSTISTELAIPALDAVDLEMLTAMNEIAKALGEQQSGSETVMLIVMIFGVAGWMVKNLILPFMEKRKNGNCPPEKREDAELANKAHKEILRSDEKDIPYIRSLPRLLREFKDEVKGLKEATRDLVNHNADRLEEFIKAHKK